MRVGVAQLVPRTGGPLRHHVGVAGVVLQSVAEIQFDVHPVGHLAQRRRRLAVGVVGVEQHRRVVRDVRQFHRQNRFGQAMGTAVGVVDDRERLAPVPLPRKQPVPQLVFDTCLPAAVSGQTLGHGRLGLGHPHAVEEPGVDQYAVTRVGGLRNISARFPFIPGSLRSRPPYNFDDR